MKRKRNRISASVQAVNLVVARFIDDMTYWRFAVLSLIAALNSLAQEAVYEDDPEILKIIKELKPGMAKLLPPVKVESGDFKSYGVEKRGPGQRDYCNKMAYAPDRRTALYAGGNHGVPHRMNDVWEYHLGSNTWHMLYEPDGGNPSKHKSAYFLTSRTLVRDPDKKLTEKEKEKIEAYREWWNANVELKNGHIATKNGGPIMPAHTWDAFCYDAASRKLLWGMGVNPAGQPATYAYYSGEKLSDVQKRLDPNYTPMWMFDPNKRKWEHYKTSKKHAALRGMGATMVHLPDHGKTLWYVAAQNVSPAAYEMWMFDAKKDEWEELKPNGGKAISTLATKEKVAPMSEVQTAYSKKHQAIVAVLKNDVFVYDVAKNEWTKAATDERIFAHDARSVFAYDEKNDVFLLAFPPDGRGKKLSLATFDLQKKAWSLITPKGDQIPETKYGSYMGYYDPHHDVFVIQGRYSDKMWVYRQ